jgi:hypothetical protein
MNYLEIDVFVDEIVQPIILENVLDYLYEECDVESFDDLDMIECFADQPYPSSVYDKIESEIKMYIENNKKYDFTSVNEHNIDEQILESLIYSIWEQEKQRHIDKISVSFNKFSDDMYDMYDY